MTRQALDVIVVGAGIHGAGVAQAAAAAGHDVLVLEKDQPASGTSSRSSKLIHGGLRYLETAQFGLVRESLREREILLRVAPDLVRMVPFYLPIYRETRRRSWQVRVGLSLYWALGGMRENTRYSSVPLTHWSGLDGLKTTGLQAVLRYHDAQTDDAALTRAVLQSAESLGAKVACPAEFRGAHRTDDGYEVVYAEDGGETTWGCRVLVNTAGAWIGDVLRRIDPPVPVPDIELVQGAHVLLKGEIENGVYYTEAPRDRRAVFIMPWRGNTLVGTTETRFDGSPDEVRPLAAEIDYLLETVHHYFPDHPGVLLDMFAGLRVLPAGTGEAFRRPRESIVATDNPVQPRLLTLAGGKLTTYRSAALGVMNRIRGSLPRRSAGVDTATLPLEPPDEAESRGTRPPG